MRDDFNPAIHHSRAEWRQGKAAAQMAARTARASGPLEPNKADISEHLYKLFSALAQQHPDTWIEIAYGHPDRNDGAVNEAKNFTVFELKEAAEFAFEQNKIGFNIYVGAALREGECPENGRACDSHALTAAYGWIDYEHPGDDDRIKAILKEHNLSPSLVVTTGNTPCPRRHLYFKLDGAVTPEQLRAVNVALKNLFGSDDVQNPSRIMRLAGTVSYPSPKKRERGYVTELVTLKKIPCAPSYRVEHLIGLGGNPPGSTSSASDHGPRSDEDLVALLQSSRGTSRWHNALRDTTASMVGRGWNDLQIRLACAPYCNEGDTDPDLIELIRSARKKFNKPDTSTADNLHTWDEPDWTMVDDSRGELPDFPLDVLSPPWQRLLLRVSHGAGVRPEQAMVPLLGVASSLIGTARRVRVSGAWSEPLTIWTCVVAQSGDRKTPALKVSTRTLDHIEKENEFIISDKRLAHETKAQKSKEVLKKWKEDREAAAENGTEPPIMPAEALEPGDFIEPRLYVNDPTIEKLTPLLLARPRGMILIRDELAGLFANMNRYSGGNDRPFWLEAWNGGRYVVERVSGSTVVPHLLVGVIGGFQPDKLSRAFKGDEDGMSGRFLYTWPSTPDYRPLSQEATEFEPELINALTALIRLPAEDAEGNFIPVEKWLDDDAIEEFEAFRQWSDKTKRGLSGLEQQWFVKGETYVLRLTATLSYLAWSISKSDPTSTGYTSITGALEPRTIAKEYMVAAIRLWRDFFWPHAKACLRQIGLSEKHKDARVVLKWIKAHRLTEVSIKDVRRNIFGQKLDAEETERLLDTMAKAGWFKKHTTETAGRPRHRWEVNPQIF